MKNILVILMVLVAMGFMIFIMFEKYNKAIEVDKKLKQSQAINIK